MQNHIAPHILLSMVPHFASPSDIYKITTVCQSWSTLRRSLLCEWIKTEFPYMGTKEEQEMRGLSCDQLQRCITTLEPLIKIQEYHAMWHLPDNWISYLLTHEIYEFYEQVFRLNHEWDHGGPFIGKTIIPRWYHTYVLSQAMKCLVNKDHSLSDFYDGHYSRRCDTLIMRNIIDDMIHYMNYDHDCNHNRSHEETLSMMYKRVAFLDTFLPVADALERQRAEESTYEPCGITLTRNYLYIKSYYVLTVIDVLRRIPGTCFQTNLGHLSVALTFIDQNILYETRGDYDLPVSCWYEDHIQENVNGYAHNLYELLVDLYRRSFYDEPLIPVWLGL
jgi:hypothetical protein